jgi:hypothetical protein
MVRSLDERRHFARQILAIAGRRRLDQSPEKIRRMTSFRSGDLGAELQDNIGCRAS